MNWINLSLGICGLIVIFVGYCLCQIGKVNADFDRTFEEAERKKNE